MKIKSIRLRDRQDFIAIYGCEHCGHEIRGSGYDDDNFHRNVIPKMVCRECGKATDENYKPLTTKYPTGIII